MTRILVVSLLVAAAAACFVFAWISNVRWTKRLNGWGAAYNCKRWPGETNHNYNTRIRARIGIR